MTSGDIAPKKNVAIETTVPSLFMTPAKSMHPTYPQSGTPVMYGVMTGEQPSYLKNCTFAPHGDDDEEDERVSVEALLNSLSAGQLMELQENVRKLTEEKAGLTMTPVSMDSTPKALKKQASTSKRNINSQSVETDIMDGIPYMTFTYSSRQEYRIRVDIDSVRVEDLPADFRNDNCVYPRACCRLEEYVGNRYEYETTVNSLAWRLTWLNQELLSGKRGLIQRAVDSYRNRFPESRSRRVIRQEKLNNGTLRRRQDDVDAYREEELPFKHKYRPEDQSYIPSVDPTSIPWMELPAFYNGLSFQQPVLFKYAYDETGSPKDIYGHRNSSATASTSNSKRQKYNVFPANMVTFPYSILQ